ncbi:hypothetical protein PybrP1_010327 [[Pythium] brassicae (nom. inval.)]|nr:hypothetical protein PybrP1_010327 [[Pythium] brassicae (nom. inval.)]
MRHAERVGGLVCVWETETPMSARRSWRSSSVSSFAKAPRAGEQPQPRERVPPGGHGRPARLAASRHPRGRRGHQRLAEEEAVAGAVQVEQPQLPPEASWLGFTLERNPFVLPVNLDCHARLASDGGRRATTAFSAGGEVASESESGRFIEVGGKRRLDAPTGSSQRPESPSRAATHAAALAERKRAKNPYETRILNDEELVPLNGRSALNSGDRGAGAAAERVRPRSRAATAALVMPSQIGELDMTRIRDAEALILQEEARCGRFTRDAQGLVIPEDEARRRRSMVEMSGNTYSALALDRQHSQSDGQDERQDTDPVSAAGVDGPNHALLRSHSLGLPGKVYAKKKAGMLGPISKPMRRPVLPGPRKRSRGAQLEEALESERRANVAFGVLIDALREEIERKEMDIAYFESIAGVQFYGDELREFRTKARRELAMLRQELSEKVFVYERKMANIHRKEEIIYVFKEKHKAAVEVARGAAIDESRDRATKDSAEAHRSTDAQAVAAALVSADRQHAVFSKLSNQEDARHAQSLVAPIVQHMCATLIQKIARGVITRAAFGHLKIEYYVSSSYIQAAVRGFLARRRVAKMFWANAASVILQRVARGMLARRLVHARRQRLRVLEGTVMLQKVVRGRIGRVRMRRVRHLCGARADIAAAGEHVRILDLKELADACAAMATMPSASESAEAPRKPLTPLVLGLVRVLMLFTSDCDASVDVSNVRWKEAASFLRCSVRLNRRMRMIASAAEGRYLRSSALGDALLDAFMADRDFHEDTFRRLESGWKAATAIFRWVASFSVISRLQTVLPAYNLGFDGPFLPTRATSSREAAQDEIEEKENVVREEDRERRFVPAALVQAAGFPRHRPRPVVLVFAHDVPCQPKASIVENVLAALPGLFVVMNRSSAAVSRAAQPKQRTAATSERSSSFLSLEDAPWASRRRRVDWEGLSISDIRGAVSVGYSVILESDVGLSDPAQRKFLGAFSAIKAAIQPSPLCILVRGSLQNCAPKGSGCDVNVGPDTYPDAVAGASATSDRTMADAAIKRAFERAAEHLAALAQAHITSQMVNVSAVENPAIQFVVVVEAVIILLTPTKRYDGPKASTSYVSWRLGQRLLANPLFFCSKLSGVRPQDVPRDNLLALGRYLRHVDWPTKTRAHSLGSSGELLFTLSSWVEAVAQCAQLVLDCQGLAPEISRTTPIRGLFSNVITYRDTNATAVGVGTESQDVGAAACVLKLMDAVLADVCVYRKCHELDGRRCIVNVYHDCLRVFFSAYDPTSCWRWRATVPESDVDVLLAPNSVERGNVKVPPNTRAEMYERLVRLCLLQAQRSRSQPSTVAASSGTSTGGPSTLSISPQASPSILSSLADKQLVVRPPSIRLYRRTLHLSGYLTTVTISELSRGRVQVDAFVHNTSHGKDIRAMFSLESILQRMSAQQAAACFVVPSKIPRLVLDRLHVFRLAQSLTTREKCLVEPQANTNARVMPPLEQQFTHLVDSKIELKLGIRTRETAPGRLLMRKAVRSPWLSALWVCSVFANHETNDFRVEFYQPQSCERLALRLSQVDCEDFVLHSKHAAKRALERMMKRFRFQVNPETESAVACCARRVLARFPWSIPVKTNPLRAVDVREVVRVYVQVEREERDAAAPSLSARSPRFLGRLRYRVCLPDTCAEQTLVLEDSEVESFFADGSWLNASCMAERKRMSRELAQCFVWEPDADVADSTSSRPASSPLKSGRVVARLPSGTVASIVSTRVTGKQKTAPPPRPPKRVKRSPFTARGCSDQIPVLSSCVQLLDATAAAVRGSGRTAADPLPEALSVKRCYTYEAEEMIHKGSYRANGALVIVQVFMKAVIVDTLVPQFPVDRVQQEDSFVMAFNVYHPHSSSRATVHINGHAELREVVGPDSAALVGASTVHALLQHIIERRTEIVLRPVEKILRGQSFRGQEPSSALDVDSSRQRGDDVLVQLEVNFQRDRLYAKQKATPINQSISRDHAANAVKLIDKASERGLKVLTKARQIRDFGRAILTVFDVGFTRRQLAGAGDHDRDLHAAAFRVDAYIHETSSRLSLTIEGAELLHVVGDRLELLQHDEASGCNTSTTAEQRECHRPARELAELIVDHIGIEARRDGVTRDRLYITEYFVPETGETTDRSTNLKRIDGEQPRSIESTSEGRRLLFRSMQALGHDQILVTAHLLPDCLIAIRCYNPRSSASCDIVIRRETLSLVLGLDEADVTPNVFLTPSIPPLALMTHICSFVRVEKQAVGVWPLASEVAASGATICASFVFDEASAQACRQRLLHDDGPSVPVASWTGMVVGTIRSTYFAVCVRLYAATPGGSTQVATSGALEATCSALSPGTARVASVRFTGSDLKRVSSGSGEAEGVASAEELLVRVRERLRVELVNTARHEGKDPGDTELNSNWFRAACDALSDLDLLCCTLK